ncbi:CHASE2 domain-containing protein [Methylophilus medardicus]|uniref:CHASE2 domain-containing protein n=1 Tax=Methylophilus medardicus TaxID=2588534 RepID=A0A5B8CRH8_9PROT|nr:CHASE2 domain-containing protein [Methylophilus medardicus]QDC43882.1 CHASE2 domain-containing protein [Methylophilus medardicus]QDC48889.1 CHASE2 domain-containing protein [Methylophilus medardicus]QDC52594.1 CHASE2 domain-containing protein [Methylophilus medardicus]
MLKLKLMLGFWLASLTRKLKNNFYLYLALLFSLVILLDAGVFHVGQNMRDKAFDLMVKNRIFKPSADPQIVIIDINEASLAAMSKEYGRWPWPRQVVGELVEAIQQQQPAAIVFDIVFSDADIYNPDSDSYFNTVISDCQHCFFPLLRLDESQDRQSQLQYAHIPGLVAAADADRQATFAAIPPYFKGAWKAGHLGTHNVYPDNDGVVRQYRMRHQDRGWTLPALPLVIANAQNPISQDTPDEMLLNWRGKPFTYHYVSFSDVYTDLTSAHPKLGKAMFKDKIVIIGSTAPALFDIKPTAMDKQFPGVEILATALDNALHQDYLKVWRGKLPYILLSLLLVWLTTLAFYFKLDRDRFNGIFTGSQIGLLVLSYLAINLLHTYLDLAAPIFWAVAYFGVAKIYALATDRALQRWLAFGLTADSAELEVLIMPIAIESSETLGDAVMKRIRREIEQACQAPTQIDILTGTQSGIWGLFGEMVMVSWQYAPETTYREAARQDALQLSAQLQQRIDQLQLPGSPVVRDALHQGRIANQTSSLAAQWRLLFAQALIQLEMATLDNTVAQHHNLLEKDA